MTKNEFKQQLIISMAGSDYLRLRNDIMRDADALIKEAEKAGITFDGDTRQPSSDVTKYRKGMQNAVVINGTVYELVLAEPEEQEQGECETCALRGVCHDAADVICSMLFGGAPVTNRHFKKL
jgi:hypothetical protein